MNNIQIKLADSEEERIQAYRIRYIVFCLEMGFINPNLHPDGLEKDKFDNRCDHVIGLVDGRIVATGRLVYHQPGEPFYSEELGVTIPPEFPKTKMSEASRAAVLKEFRAHKGLGTGMLDCVYEKCKRLNLCYMLTLANEKMYAVYKKVKIPIALEDKGINCHGYISFPLIFKIKKNYFIIPRQ
jgi:hypothetical protein